MLSQIIKSILSILLILSIRATANCQPHPTPIPSASTGIVNVVNSAKPVLITSHTSTENLYAFKLMALTNTDSIVNIDTRFNVKLFLSENDKITNLRINVWNVDTLRIVGNKKTQINLAGSNRAIKVANAIIIEHSYISDINLSSRRIKCLAISDSKVKSLKLMNVKIDNDFILNNTRLYKTNFEFSDLPDTITMYSLKLETADKNLDLIHIKDKEDSRNFERTLKIGNTDLDRIQLNYGRFNFHVDPDLDLRNARWMFEKIIWYCQQYGLQSKVDWYKEQLAIIEDADSKSPITNIINSLWWNRGHNKTRAICITFGIFLCFFALNWWWFNSLKKTYYPKSFEDYFARIDRMNKVHQHYPQLKKIKWSNRRSKFARTSGIFMYSGFIFWNIKVDMDILRMRKLGFCLFLLFQHLVGLLFIANIIGFITIKA